METAAMVIGAVTMPEPSWKRKRARQACDHCRAKKIRCNGENTTRQFGHDITRRLKMDADISIARAPEPDAETAWRYTEAYFSESLDASLGVLYRPWFERQLAAHLSGSLCDNGPTRHALRNVVYAAGCRIELSKSRPFTEACQQAWMYFEDVLRVYARLLFYKTSITGVQVLTLMAYYTQNIGTPCLEYMLSSDAVRLAFAKGLHRAARPAQGLTEQDIEQRNRIFWAIYCLEKQIATQSSRPSMIDDDEVTCSLPRFNASVGDAFSLAYGDSLVRVSRVSSRIEKRLSAVQCSRMGPTATMQAVDQLHSELESVKNSLHDRYKLNLSTRIFPSSLPPNFKLEQLVYLQYAYLTALLSVHTIWAYPWIRTMLGLSAEDKFRDHVVRSAEIVARTSREVIVMTEHIHFRSQATVPVAFFAPIYAMISLFICCLDRGKGPLDSAIMDIGTGYFARLGLDTDFSPTTPFVRAITSLAYEFEGPERTFGSRPFLTLDALMHLEDWSTFSRTSPAQMVLDRVFF
ncbi:hypothetical protein BST61_g4726 [Cercospora zeina]